MRGATAKGTGDRFGRLLLVLIVTYVVSAFTSGFWIVAFQIVLLVTAALLAVRTSHLGAKATRVAVVVCASGSLIALALALAPSGHVGEGIADLWIALILVFAVILIVRRVLAQPQVTLESIYGAVSAYTVIGLMFAAFYAAMAKFDGGAFFTSGQPGTVKTFQYFSFTTLTTLGYGDFTAAGNDGRAVAVMEALLGQVFLATLVARLVASFRPLERRSVQDRTRSRQRQASRRIRLARDLPAARPAHIHRRSGGKPSP